MKESMQAVFEEADTFRNEQRLGEGMITVLNSALSRVFQTKRPRMILVGSNPCTRLLATELLSVRTLVTTIDITSTEDQQLLGQANARSARCIVAASSDDSRNLSLCRKALSDFGVPLTIARLRVVEGATSWARVTEAGISRMSWKHLLQAVIPEVVLSPTLLRLSRADDFDQISDIELRFPLFIGRRIEDLPLSGCDVVVLTRKGIPVANCQSTSLELCDVLTVIGTRTAVHQLRESIASL